MENNLYNLAQQDLDINGEDVTLLAFKEKYKLQTGFYKKPIEFFLWLYKKEYGKISETKFKQSFIGRMIKFDKKNIPNYTELVIEYEKIKRTVRKRNETISRKTKIERLPKIRQD